MVIRVDWPESSVLPIVIYGEIDERKPHRPVGTGFILGHGLFVTCWHCVEEPLDDGYRYVATPVDPATGKHVAVPLLGLGQDANGSDLALARVEPYRPNDRHLRLAQGSAPQGQPVWSYGYPLPEFRDDHHGRKITRLTGRLLKGYITMGTILDEPGREGMAAYELDMPAPRGLSGAPVLIDAYASGSPDIVGVVQGTHDIEQVEDIASIDPKTGTRIPERVRIVTFAIAVETTTLRNARGEATGGLSVAEFLAAFDPGGLAMPRVGS
jgi:hypothetical protein